jgi:SAM-dependent methyltransferase
VWVFFERHTDLFDQRPRSMLHIAPEWELSCKLKVQPNLRYVTADLNMPWVSVRFDINQLPHPDGGFDVVYCSHVLEHIPDDRRAMREICRVLKPGGWAVIIVPITTDVTFEDLSVTDPDERHRLFGQNDHVRRYGPDIENRLADSGFDVQVFQAADVVDEDEGRRLAIPFKSSPMYYCKRPA